MKSPMPHDIVNNICRRVAELPGRDSPADWPAAMLVTGPELALIVREEMQALDERCVQLFAELTECRANLADSEARRMEDCRTLSEDVETAERIADTMRDMVDDMTADVMRLRVRAYRWFCGTCVALVLLSGAQLWRAYA